jgi:hypothetical protein
MSEVCCTIPFISRSRLCSGGHACVLRCCFGATRHACAVTSPCNQRRRLSFSLVPFASLLLPPSLPRPLTHPPNHSTAIGACRVRRDGRPHARAGGLAGAGELCWRRRERGRVDPIGEVRGSQPCTPRPACCVAGGRGWSLVDFPLLSLLQPLSSMLPPACSLCVHVGVCQRVHRCGCTRVGGCLRLCASVAHAHRRAHLSPLPLQPPDPRSPRATKATCPKTEGGRVGGRRHGADSCAGEGAAVGFGLRKRTSTSRKRRQRRQRPSQRPPGRPCCRAEAAAVPTGSGGTRRRGVGSEGGCERAAWLAAGREALQACGLTGGVRRARRASLCAGLRVWGVSGEPDCIDCCHMFSSRAGTVGRGRGCRGGAWCCGRVRRSCRASCAALALLHEWLRPLAAQ